MKRRKFLQVAGAGLATTAIAAPAIAQSMPELKWRFGYPAILIVMGLVSLTMLMYFRRKKWF